MIKEELINCTVEALILASPEPVSLRKLSETMDSLPVARIRQAVADLNNLYMGCGNSFRIREVAGGYQVHILPDFERVIKNLLSKERTVRLTRAALETLSIIAYKQPVTKIEIDHIRGVSSDGVLHNLLERKLIVISGRAETPGRPLLYKTSNEFLKFFGLNRLSDLPRLEEIEEMIREAEPSRDQAEMQFDDSVEMTEDNAETDADIDDDMIAHVHSDVDETESETDEQEDGDDDSENPPEMFGADFDPELMAERETRTAADAPRKDGGNGNGSALQQPELDEDSAAAVDLVFGDRSALEKESLVSTMIYLPATDNSSADSTGDESRESSEAPAVGQPESGASDDRRTSDE